MNFMSNADFCQHRQEILQEIIALKKIRRVALGPDMTVLFEHPRFIWWQIQEMLRIENGSSEQLEEEWETYRPLLPTRDQITLTLMIEIDDPVARKKALSKRLGIHRSLFLEGAGFCLQSEPLVIGLPMEDHGMDRKEALLSPRVETRGRDFPSSEREDSSERKDLGVQSEAERLEESGKVMQGREGEGKGHGESPREGGREVSGAKSPVEEKINSVHFLRFSLNQGARHAFALGEPVLSCQHPQALYRTPITTALWNALCHDQGTIPLK